MKYLDSGINNLNDKEGVVGVFLTLLIEGVGTKHPMTLQKRKVILV